MHSGKLEVLHYIVATIPTKPYATQIMVATAVVCSKHDHTKLTLVAVVLGVSGISDIQNSVNLQDGIHTVDSEQTLRYTEHCKEK